MVWGKLRFGVALCLKLGQKGGFIHVRNWFFRLGYCY